MSKKRKKRTKRYPSFTLLHFEIVN